MLSKAVAKSVTARQSGLANTRWIKNGPCRNR